MFLTIRNAAATARIDERQMAVLAMGACPQAGLAALGHLVGQIVQVLLRDRREMRSWLSQAAREIA